MWGLLLLALNLKRIIPVDRTMAMSSTIRAPSRVSKPQAVLRALHQSVLEGGLTADGVHDYGAQVPCAQLVCRRLRDHTWPLLQLLLLEGRVLLVSKSAARASAAAWGLASLLPGAIGAGLGHYRSATDAPRFRWKRFGLPLALFSDGDGADGRVNGSRAAAAPGNDSYHTSGNNSIEGSGTSSSSCSGGSTKRRGEFVCLAPLVPMADASRVFEHASYLAGTANQMVKKEIDVFLCVNTVRWISYECLYY